MTWGTITGGSIDLYSWNSMYPYNYITNYGGQTQFNLMPAYYTPQQAFNIQNLFNPLYQGLSMLNTFASYCNPYPNPQQAALGQMAYNQGYSIGLNIGFNALANLAINNINGLQSQLETALTAQSLTAEQKAQLEGLKRSVDALKAQMEALMQSNASPDVKQAALDTINEQYRELSRQSGEIAKQIQEAITATEDEPTEEPAEEPDAGTTPVRRTQTAAPSNKDIRDWAARFNNSVSGWGTNDDEFERCLKEIDETNIIEFVDYYDKHFSGKGFYFDFLADAEHSQKKEFTPIILNALETRAESLGISDEIIEEVRAIRDELQDWNISKTIISNQLKSITAKIQAAEQDAE